MSKLQTINRLSLVKTNRTHISKEIIGKLIKQQRLNKQMTQQELADLLNVDRQYVWNIENGKINLTLDYLDKIIAKLKCTHNEFLNSDN
jgi:repressor LexA